MLIKIESDNRTTIVSDSSLKIDATIWEAFELFQDALRGMGYAEKNIEDLGGRDEI